MRMSVEVGGKNYGDYESEDFGVVVGYRNQCRSGPGSNRAAVRRKVAPLLLGKTATGDIVSRCDWEGKRVIALKGDKLTTLHVDVIAECWDTLDFSRTSFAKSMEALQQEIRKEWIAKDENLQIELEFHYRDIVNQLGGNLRISRKVALWLGKALIDAASGEMVEDSTECTVKSGTPQDKKGARAWKTVPTRQIGERTPKAASKRAVKKVIKSRARKKTAPKKKR
jgi:hypothetical protein